MKIDGDGMNSKVLYTVITGDYDNLYDISIPGWDLICFSDAHINSSSWEIVKIDGDDKRKLSRIPKILWFDYLDYDMAVYADANLHVNNLDQFIKYHKKGHHTAFKHWQRDCVYDEADAIIKLKKDDFNPVRRYIEKLRADDYPKHNGLLANCVMIRDRDTPYDPYVNWWVDVKNYSYRDQLSFMPNVGGLMLNGIDPDLRFQYFKKVSHK